MKQRIVGLDSIRFVCAFIVVIEHTWGGFSFLTGINKDTTIGRWSGFIFNSFISGPGAVIVFFVISGFCIHFPYRNGAKIDYPTYYLSRYIRIVFPCAAIILVVNILSLFGILNVDAGLSVIWSLVCELIYYTLYPGLSWLKKRIGWTILLISTFAFAYALVLLLPGNGNYQGYGYGLTWILGLPCWLAGCHLAEHYQRFASNTRHIWFWRVGFAFGLFVCQVLRFQSPISIGHQQSLNIFAIFVYFWLAREVNYFQRVKPVASFERMGRWSYSLYLSHTSAIAIFLGLDLQLFAPLRAILLIAFILFFAYCFYLIVEQPSHQLAKKLRQKKIEPLVSKVEQLV